MRSIYLIILTVVAITFVSCKKDNGEKYTIKGRLLQSCDNSAPVAGKNIILEEYTGTIGSKYETLATTTTDENGAFSISYSAINKSGPEKISLKPQDDRGYYLTSIPKNENIEANVYTKDNFFYTIIIKTSKAYTARDTLFYTFGTDTRYIIGPFTDNQVLDTLTKTIFQGWTYGRSEQSVLIDYTWKLGSQYNDPASGNVVKAYLTPCNKYGEVVLDLTKAIK